MDNEICRSCGAYGLEEFYRVDRAPVHSCRLVESQEESLGLPMGELQLGCCPKCGFIQNRAFDSALVDYSENYEDSQAFSGRFNDYVAELADHLVSEYKLNGKTVLEIGCGRGDFLRLICERGSMSGLGFDPAYRNPEHKELQGDGIRIFNELYPSEGRPCGADLVVCRHTLEHLPDVHEFVRTVRGCLSRHTQAIVCFEVPDVQRILKEAAFWDIYYEHCSYFSTGSLEWLFRAAGFDVLDVRRTYQDQYIVIEAKPAQSEVDARADGHELEELWQDVRSFQDRVSETLGQWRKVLDRYSEEARRVAVWGAGSKASGFLTALGVTDEVGCLVDINPGKQGYYQAGTAQRIVGPRDLNDYRPDVVIVMNPVYMEEIKRDLDGMGLGPKILSL